MSASSLQGFRNKQKYEKYDIIKTQHGEPMNLLHGWLIIFRIVCDSKEGTPMDSLPLHE